MTLEEVKNNLVNTINAKKSLLKAYEDDKADDWFEDLVTNASIQYLEININELERILIDIELCMNDKNASSWVGCVDRMSGAFDERELNGRDGWL